MEVETVCAEGGKGTVASLLADDSLALGAASSALTFESFELLSEQSYNSSSSSSSTISRPTHRQGEDFAKSLHVSPDGSLLLLTSEEHTTEVYSIDQSMIESHKYYQPGGKNREEDPLNDFQSALAFRKAFFLGENIYDCSWYPYTNNLEVSSACFVTTCRDKPVQLFGVADGLRCSYCVHNAVTFRSDNSIFTRTSLIFLPLRCLSSQ